MKRYPDWPARLNEYLNKVKDRKFRIGRYDGLSFTAGAIKAMTGESPHKHLLGYKSYDEAKAVFKKHGGSLYHCLLKTYGKPVNAAKAHQGDLAYINKPGFDMPNLGIVLGRRTLIFGIKGYLQVRTIDINCAFRVPFGDGIS